MLLVFALMIHGRVNKLAEKERVDKWQAPPPAPKATIKIETVQILTLDKIA